MTSVNSCGKSAFGTFQPNNSSSDNLRNKKAKSLFCVATSKGCAPTKLVANANDLYLFRTYVANKQPRKYNARNLNINLITSLDLSNVTVVESTCTQASPIPIDPPGAGEERVEFIADPMDPTKFIEHHVPMSENVFPMTENVDDGRYTLYTIDPKGELFGNTPCGLNNYVNYMVINPELIIE
jgi:hypothetical protein